VANAVAACVSSTCAIGSCSPGFGDCDGLAANGCETPTSNDPKNCGTCFHACPIGGTCSGGACQGGNFVHSDGLGDSWTDATPAYTYNLAQATTACKTYLQKSGLAGDICQGYTCTMGTTQLVAVAHSDGTVGYQWYFQSDGVSFAGNVEYNGCDTMVFGTWY
jgi:hypothetical protein